MFLISVNNFLAALHPVFQGLNGLPLWIFLIVATLTFLFLIGYLFKGLQVWWQLWNGVRKLRSLKRAGQAPDPAEITKILASEPLKHLWEEYADTLHQLRKGSGAGGALVEIRATVPAETFFTREVLVDGRLFDDFTRHLPGVLTGLGIIGTFAGLLDGLKSFDPTTTASAVSGLKPLLDGVRHAFVASAVAISCAMLVTFISKFVLAYFYGLVEHLSHTIDSLYSTGAGEEYLARLVQASEMNEAHTAQLKDALVEDLTKLMTNLTDRQINANAEYSKALGTAVTGALADPLKKISIAVEETSKGNSDAVSGMLQTVLTGFMTKLEETFGSQMRGINEQMQKSMQAMSNVQLALTQLVADIAKTNETATDQMSGKLEEAMKRASENQAMLTNQMREFVGEFRKLVTAEQDKSRQIMDDSIEKVLKRVTAAVEQLENVRVIAADDERQRGKELTAKTGELLGGLSQQVEDLLKSVAAQVQLTQENINKLDQVSTRAIDGMNQGALSMGSAASKFETAGTTINSIFDKSAEVSDQLSITADSLQAAASAVQQGFEHYDATRQTVGHHVAALTGLIETVKRESGLSAKLIRDFEVLTTKLAEAESQSRDYLEQVNATLSGAFEQFSTSLLGQLKATIAETDKHLGKGVGHLNGVVQELAAAMARMKRN